MSANKRRTSSKRTTTSTTSSKRPLTLAEEEAQLREQIYRLENRVAHAPAEISDADTWRRSPTRALPTSVKARQTRERTSVLIELAFSTVLLLGAALWLWQRFAK
jgi:hypothetical protein